MENTETIYIAKIKCSQRFLIIHTWSGDQRQNSYQESIDYLRGYLTGVRTRTKNVTVLNGISENGRNLPAGIEAESLSYYELDDLGSIVNGIKPSRNT
ncbi:MAG: hypothetical protein AABX23_03855 [Nanoarchaeota archaeon]